MPELTPWPKCLYKKSSSAPELAHIFKTERKKQTASLPCVTRVAFLTLQQRGFHHHLCCQTHATHNHTRCHEGTCRFCEASVERSISLTFFLKKEKITVIYCKAGVRPVFVAFRLVLIRADNVSCRYVSVTMKWFSCSSVGCHRPSPGQCAPAERSPAHPAAP